MVITPSPPEKDDMAIRLFWSGGRYSKTLARSKNSSSPCTRIAPVCFRAASITVSVDFIRAPVCEEAALAPAAVRPDLRTMTGFFLVVLSRRRMNFLASPAMLSRCTAITFVLSSSPKYSRASTSLISILLPRSMSLFRFRWNSERSQLSLG